MRGDGDRLDAQPLVAQHGAELAGQPVVAQPKIDEARPGDLGRLAKIRHVEPGQQVGGHFAWAAAQAFAQRHREVRLVVAERGVLRRSNHIDQPLELIGCDWRSSVEQWHEARAKAGL